MAIGGAMLEELRSLRLVPEWLPAIARPEPVKRAIQRSIPELTSGRTALEHVEPGRIRLEDRVWSGRYELTLGGADGRRQVLPVLAFGDRRRVGDLDGVSPGAALGEAGWRCALPELGCVLETPPPDTSLPALPIITDPVRARALLEETIRAGTLRYSDIRIAACTPRVAQYQPGRRCTVVYRLEYGGDARGRGWPEAVVAKADRGDEGSGGAVGRGGFGGRHAYTAMRRLWQSGLGRSPAVTIAEPLGFSSDLGVLIQAAVPGEKTLGSFLKQALARGTSEDREALQGLLAKTARGLAALHGCGVHGPVVTWEQDMAELRGRVARLTPWVPGLDGALEAPLSRLEALAAESPPQELVPSHRSFRPTQILVHEGRVAFIDFDGLCEAEPAMDLARFRATAKNTGIRVGVDEAGQEPSHSQLLARAAEVDRLCDLFLSEYEQVASVSRVRVALWETVYLLMHALNSWRKVKPETLAGNMILLERHLRQSALPLMG